MATGVKADCCWRVCCPYFLVVWRGESCLPMQEVPISVLPPLDLDLADSPAYPYTPKSRPEDPGMTQIVSERDVEFALEDQVLKLGSDFDRNVLPPFYRFVWLLNKSSRQRSLQGYLGRFRIDDKQGFYSDVLLNPYDQPSDSFLIDLAQVQELASEYSYRLSLALEAQDPNGWRIKLRPVRTKFGLKPNLQLGYMLSIRIEATMESQERAAELWAHIVSSLESAFEERPTRAASN